MNKLTKTQLNDRSAIALKVQDARAALEADVNAFNAKVKELWAEMIDPRVRALNDALNEARNFCDEIVSTAQSYYDDKSEKWQDSDKGSAYQDFIQEWENVELDDVELDEPDEVEFDEECTDIESLTDAVGS